MLPNVSHSSSHSVEHVPVLASEVAELLDLQPGDTVVDGTFGAGGHAALLEPQLRGHGCYIAIDRDPEAERHFKRFAAGASADTRFIHGNFALVLRNLAATGLRADALVLDLGISSMQIDRPERGFSYAADAPLDMRMDPTGDLTAAEIVNEWDEREIAQLLRGYGEERFSRQIARAIVRRRAREPFARTGDLVDVIKAAIPTPSRFGQGHPAKRSFQALRIAVNDELESLSEGLDHALELLAPEGRMAVISFHSLEDRIVKRFIRNQARGCTCPPDFPICVCGHEPLLRALDRPRGGAERGRALRQPALRVGQAARGRKDAGVSVVAPAPAAPSRPRRAAPATETAPKRRQNRRRPATLARPRAGRSPVAPGVLWVLLIATLLGGIVALNVGALRNSISASKIEGQEAALRSQNDALRSLVAQRSGSGRINAYAVRYGMVSAQPQRNDYLRLHPLKHASRRASDERRRSRRPAGR